MKRNKGWIKYIIYFVVGFIVFSLIFLITEVEIIKKSPIDINVNTIIFSSIRSIIGLYIVSYILGVILNTAYNARLIKKLNKESEKLRKTSENFYKMYISCNNSLHSNLHRN